MRELSFSAIIPTYGRSELASRAVMSILNQSYQAHEVIVVDDGSDPPIGEAVKQGAENVRLIRLPVNSGVSVARNAGMLAAEAEYIAFLNSDDSWEPRRLEAAKE